MDKKKIWDSYKFPIILLGGIFIGAIIGLIMGEDAAVFAPIGDIFLNLMFTIVVPMVFVSIASSVGAMVNMKRLGKILGSLVLTFIVTGLFASVLVLVVVNIWPPAAGTTITMGTAEVGETASVGEMIVGMLTVDDFSGLMSRKNMLPIIIASVATGFAVAACGGEESPVGKLLNNLNAIIMKLVDMIMKLAPIGLGAYFANLVGKFGPQLIGDYGRTMLIYYPMCLVYVFVFFPLYSWFAGGKLGVSRMAKNIINPAELPLLRRVLLPHCLLIWKHAKKSVYRKTSTISFCQWVLPCIWMVLYCHPLQKLLSFLVSSRCHLQESALMLWPSQLL